MSTKPVVAGTDGSEESLQAVEWAAREAALHGAALRIVSAAETLAGMHERHDSARVATVTDVLSEQRDSALAQAAQRAGAVAPELVIDTDELHGPIAKAVADSGSGAGLLVVGSRGIGAFAAMILGSVSRFAAAHAACPVAVVRGMPADARGQLGVGIRDTETCTDALAFAFEEAALRKAGLIVVYARHGHVAAGEDAEGALTSMLADWRDKYPAVQVTQDIADGHPGHVLSELSSRTDLVVIGRRPANATGRGAGKVRNALLHHAQGPVVTVPSA
jgi:nucleotide-binding universal stress UspA family protein